MQTIHGGFFGGREKPIFTTVNVHNPADNPGREDGHVPAQVTATLYRHNGEWKVHAIGENASGRTFDDLMLAMTSHL